ncbi:MAG: hypothetical protein ACYTFG_07740 [Planctomycetota bacterium]|jgi:hypothetical protein
MKTLVTVLSIVILVLFAAALTAWATRPGEAAFREHMILKHGITESMISDRSRTHMKIARNPSRTTTFNWFFRDKLVYTRFWVFTSTVGANGDPKAFSSKTSGYVGVFGVFFKTF